MKSSPLRQTCLSRLRHFQGRGLEIPRPFDAAQLCQRVGEVLGKHITLVGMPMPAGAPFGLTLFTDIGHVIAYEEHTSRVHRDHIIAHELGHILLDHRALALDDPQASRLLLPALRPRMVDRVLNRTGVYSRREEQEAEMMATILLELAVRESDASTQDTGTPPATGTDAALEARLRHGLEPPPR
ncbi:hypothetical protein [Micromonospora sp. NBC_01813]|uniref:hypothetical protein n=1 Tax=Micromonospora sp. NBC_01813 TaxID=2975988 RepID=UPI002DDBC569|nr:hypothetical protein [Micromonospora sp. NBC_01813]WSA10361.1 ImmA/IrrE family metallo-endopeptidase [Micromonospora sp. NBC_01813]